jgi:hypothetical protein
MAQVKIGDYVTVTGYGSGYRQLIDIKPKIATEDYVRGILDFEITEEIQKA